MEYKKYSINSKEDRKWAIEEQKTEGKIEHV